MNHAELIAEAHCVRDILGWTDGEDVITKLTAALRELAPPEGWSASEYTQSGSGNQAAGIEDEWQARHGGGEWLRDATGEKAIFPTASAAMAALDGESKS